MFTQLTLSWLLTLVFFGTATLGSTCKYINTLVEMDMDFTNSASPAHTAHTVYTWHAHSQQ